MSKQTERPIRDYIRIFGPAILIVLASFVLAYQFVDPAPPRHIRIATGQQGGAYHLFAQRYQQLLAREGIELELVASAGSIENIRLLQQGQADIAFVQGGLADSGDAELLFALGSLYFEPVWVFYRKGLRVQQLTDLRERRVAVGAEGSGTRALALQVLAANAINTSNSRLLPHSGREAADALLAGEIDAAFFVASPQSPVVRALLDAADIGLMDFTRADAYTRIYRFLSRVVLPQGVVSLQRNQPPEATTLLATSASLVARSDLHPALIDLLLQTATEIHGSGGWFEQSGQFPTPEFIDFPLAKEAKRFYKHGPPFLQRYLPFWAATLIDRLKVMLLPLVALLLPLFKIMPPLYRWRMRARIYPWYRDVLAIDRRLYKPQSAADIRQSLERLDSIEQEVSRISVPLSFVEELYDLRLHIGMVRERLKNAGGGK